MPKFYKTKPCKIVAEQWTGNNIEEIINFAGNNAEFNYESLSTEQESEPTLIINSLEGRIPAATNDFIIRGVIGEYYPCNPKAFKEKYEETESELSLGSLYEINKQASAAEKILTREELRKGLSDIAKFVSDIKQKYYMLLNRETSNYTLFSFHKNEYINFDLTIFKNELKECLLNRGKVVSIEQTKDKQAFEIWIRTETEDLVYYFFPYDVGVIEI